MTVRYWGPDNIDPLGSPPDRAEWYPGSVHDMTAPLDALTLAGLASAYHALGQAIKDPGPGMDVAAAVRRRDAIRESMEARGDDG
jgi:hypothetical protein